MLLPNTADYPRSDYAKAKSEKSIVEFKGLNLLPVCGSGEFSGMRNLSSRSYPCLSPRPPRGIYAQGLEGAAAFTIVGSSGKAAYVLNSELFYDEVSRGSLGAAFADCKRQLLEFQDRLLIWPDRMYYDISDDTLGTLYASVSLNAPSFTASVEDSALNDSVKYSAIAANSPITAFGTGDAVTVTGCSTAANNITAPIDHISSDNKTLYFAENSFTDAAESGSVTVARNVPDMEHICVANNRVWGCKGSSIYASKLGSAENWNYFTLSPGGAPSSVSSYAVDFTTPGDFTGCHRYGAYLAFFKEDCIHKLLGTKPSNYQRSDIVCPGLGLERGSGKSMAYLAGELCYKSRLGIVAFAGGVPTLISAKLGERWSCSSAASDGRRYYVSARGGGGHSLLCYDSFYRLWHREDELQVTDFAQSGGRLYMLSADGTVYINEDESAGEIVSWSGTLGEFAELSAEKKIQSRLRLRVELPASSTLKLEYSADGGDWVTAYSGSGAMRQSFYISITPTRCDSFTLRLSGSGDCKIYQIDRVFSRSTDAE